MKIKICSAAILFFLCSAQIVFAQENSLQQGESEPKEIFLGVLNDKAIVLPLPKYPKEVLQPRTQGGVNVQVKVNLQTGNVVSALAISGNPLFRKYAEEAALLARFKAKKIEGSPLFATGTIVYKHPSDSNSVQETKTGLPVIVVGVVNKRAVRLPKPIYPKSCRCSGTIKVRIVVDMNGKVISATADSGNPLFRVAAVQAARETKFSPTRIDGPPVYVVAFLEYKFYSNGKVST